jgi:hypothetical protein
MSTLGDLYMYNYLPTRRTTCPRVRPLVETLVGPLVGAGAAVPVFPRSKGRCRAVPGAAPGGHRAPPWDPGRRPGCPRAAPGVPKDAVRTTGRHPGAPDAVRWTPGAVRCPPGAARGPPGTPGIRPGNGRLLRGNTGEYRPRPRRREILSLEKRVSFSAGRNPLCGGQTNMVGWIVFPNRPDCQRDFFGPDQEKCCVWGRF